jgi:hypothetical protein
MADNLEKLIQQLEKMKVIMEETATLYQKISLQNDKRNPEERDLLSFPERIGSLIENTKNKERIFSK